MPLRIIFMGTPDFSVPVLRALHAAGMRSRGLFAAAAAGGAAGAGAEGVAVHEAAEALGIEVRTPVNFKAEEDREAFRALNADVAVVVAYGLLLPKAILEGRGLGAITAMPRCCRAGAAPRPSSGRSWRAMPRPA